MDLQLVRLIARRSSPPAALVAVVADDLVQAIYSTRTADYRVAVPLLRILFVAGFFACAGAAARSTR